MVSIDVGGSGNKRDINRDLPLIPFIDFLLCLISFLLITAVWSQLARIEANAKVPGIVDVEPSKVEKRLHVHVNDRRFSLVWKQGGTVLATSDVERKPVPVGNNGDITYPALANRLKGEWETNGMHRDGSDQTQDLAVLHASNTTPFADLVAVMDALKAPQRELAVGDGRQRVSAFSVSFATD